MMTLRSSKR